MPGCTVAETGDLEGIARDPRAVTMPSDLVLLDLALPDARGFSGLIMLRAEYPGVPVVVVSGNTERGAIRRCLDFGAAGFIPKTSDLETMRTAIRSRALGRSLGAGLMSTSRFPPIDETADLVRRMASLTPQQLRVLMMVQSGRLNKQIAWDARRVGGDR